MVAAGVIDIGHESGGETPKRLHSLCPEVRFTRMPSVSYIGKYPSEYLLAGEMEEALPPEPIFNEEF